MNIIFNSLLAQLVKYDVHTTRKIKSTHAIFITYYYFYVLLNDCAILQSLINTSIARPLLFRLYGLLHEHKFSCKFTYLQILVYVLAPSCSMSKIITTMTQQQ